MVPNYQQVTIGLQVIILLNYQSGKINVDADVFSQFQEGNISHMEADSVHALISQVVQGTT